MLGIVPSATIVVDNNAYGKVESKDEPLPDYIPCICSTGCVARAKYLPCTAPVSIFICLLNTCAPLLLGECVYFPICVNDYLCVDALCPYANITDLPMAFGPGDYKAVIHSKRVKDVENLPLGKFLKWNKSLSKAAIEELIKEAMEKPFKILGISASACGIDDELCLPLCKFIYACSELISFDLSENDIGDVGFEKIIHSLCLQSGGKRLSEIKLPFIDPAAIVKPKMFLADFNQNRRISGAALLNSCQRLKDIKYPILISLLGIYTRISPELENAFLELRTCNDNVRFLISEDYYRRWYSASVKHMPNYHNIAISSNVVNNGNNYAFNSVTPSLNAVPAIVQDMNRENIFVTPKPIQQVPKIPAKVGLGFIDEYEMWERRVGECAKIFGMQNDDRKPAYGTAISMFENYSFTDIANIYSSMYPGIPLPDTWQEEIGKRFYVGKMSQEILSQIKEDYLNQ